jgi:hypothetical protein
VIIRSVCCEKIARTYVEVVAVVVDVVVVVDSVRVAVLVIVAVEVIVLVGWRYEEQKTLAAAIRVLCVLRVSLVWCFTNRSLLRISQSPEYVVRIAALCSPSAFRVRSRSVRRLPLRRSSSSCFL